MVQVQCPATKQVFNFASLADVPEGQVYQVLHQDDEHEDQQVNDEA